MNILHVAVVTPIIGNSMFYKELKESFGKAIVPLGKYRYFGETIIYTVSLFF